MLCVCLFVCAQSHFSANSNGEVSYTSFDDMWLNDQILRGIYSYGFEKPSLVQVNEEEGEEEECSGNEGLRGFPSFDFFWRENTFFDSSMECFASWSVLSSSALPYLLLCFVLIFFGLLSSALLYSVSLCSVLFCSVRIS